MTQEPPKKSYEAGPSEQLATYAFSKIDLGALDTVKVAKMFACANELRKGHFGKFE